MHCAGEQTGEMRSGVIEDILISYVQIRGAAIEVDVIRRKQLRTGADHRSADREMNGINGRGDFI